MQLCCRCSANWTNAHPAPRCVQRLYIPERRSAPFGVLEGHRWRLALHAHVQPMVWSVWQRQQHGRLRRPRMCWLADEHCRQAGALVGEAQPLPWREGKQTTRHRSSLYVYKGEGSLRAVYRPVVHTSRHRGPVVLYK